MARPRKPTNLLRLNGAFKSNPQRERERINEPIVNTPIGECPEWLTDRQRQAWADIVTYAPARVLTSADRVAVELAAVLLARSRSGKISSAQSAQLLTLLGKFGMNPADRSKVSAAPAAKETAWGAFGT